MRSFIAALAISTALVSPAHAGPAEDYTELREEIWQATLDSSPQLATSVGDRRGDGKLGDLSLEEYDRQVEENRAFLARLNAIDESALPEDLRIDYAILKRSFEDNIEGAAFDQNRYVIFTNRGGWFTWFASLPYRSPLFTLVPSAPNMVFIKAGTLDDTSGIVPAVHIWTKSKQEWLDLGDAPQVERNPG